MELEVNKQKQQEISIEKEQRNFLDTTIGKIINTAIDMGLRFVIPDVIEDKIIDIKNVLFQEGLQKGIQSTVDDVINIGKSAVGIITGEFDNIEQIQMAVEKGGIIESTSSLIDLFVNKATQKGKIDSNIANLIKKGKNVILDNISSNIESMLTDQVKSIEKIQNYSEKWRSCYMQKDFEGMEKEYKKIEQEIKNIIPIENIIKESREIENIHKLIRNNGRVFELTDNQLKASKILV